MNLFATAANHMGFVGLSESQPDFFESGSASLNSESTAAEPGIPVIIHWNAGHGGNSNGSNDEERLPPRRRISNDARRRCAARRRRRRRNGDFCAAAAAALAALGFYSRIKEIPSSIATVLPL